MNRAKTATPQPATPQSQTKAIGPYTLSATPGTMGDTQPTAPSSPSSPQQAHGGLISQLREALTGTTSIAEPKTGMTAPAWPGIPMPMGPGDLPVGAPTDAAKVPPRWDRFQTAQKMSQAYRDGWQPNPLLIRVLEGS